MKAHRAYIKSALASGYHIRIDLGDEVIKCKDSYKAAIEAAECVDEGAILVVSAKPNPETGKYVLYGTAFYLLQSGPDEEYIYDYTCTTWNGKFFDKYYDDPRFHGAVEF